jgi:small GTP-binding protein
MVYRIKVIIIGEAGVGKTSLVKKFVSGRFTSDYRVSIGANLFVKELILNSDINVTIQIWDIAGQEKWVKMRHLYYRGAHGALIVGDLTRGNTFEQLKEFWNPDLKKFCGDIPKILVVNKVDLEPIVSNSDIEKLAQDINVKATIITSAKNGQNVEEAFHQIAETIITSNILEK